MSAFPVRLNRPQRLAVAATTLVLLGTAILPASAGTNIGDGSVTYLSTQLSRVGTQLVRGDILTGAGVSAPSWIPELP
jgi:hypothetical protein